MADRGSFTAAEAVAKYLPPGQSVHEGLPDASAYIPAAQMVQSASWLLPESWPYLPATQSMQPDCPGKLLYVPAPQSAQVSWPASAY